MQMRFIRKIAVFLCVVSVGLSSGLSSGLSFGPSGAMAALPACQTNLERETMAVRSFQSYLMVAAVACGQSQAYNQFISKHQNALAGNGQHLRAYFKRVYGDRASEKKLTDFITDLANVWSQIHMGDMKGYCTGTWNTMWHLTHGARATFDQVKFAASEVASHPKAVSSLCSDAFTVVAKNANSSANTSFPANTKP